DHADAGQFHRNVNAGTIGTEKLVENLPGIAGAGKNKGLACNLFERNFGAAGQRILAANHEAHAVFINVVNLEVGRLERHGDDADVHGAVLDASQNFMAKVAVDADVNLRIFALEFSENVRQKIKAGGLVGAKDDRALHHVATIGDDLNGFISEAEEAFGIVEEDFAGGGQLDGFGRAVEKLGALGLFKLANLSTGRRLPAQNPFSPPPKAPHPSNQ